MESQAEAAIVRSSAWHPPQTMLGISNQASFCYGVGGLYCPASCSSQAFQSQEEMKSTTLLECKVSDL